MDLTILLEREKPYLSRILTHNRHSVDVHCEEVEKIFCKLFEHYHFEKNALKIARKGLKHFSKGKDKIKYFTKAHAENIP